MKGYNILILLCMGLLFLNLVSAEVMIDSYYFDDYYIEPGDDIGVYVKFHRTATESLLGAQGKITYDISKVKILREESPDEFYIIKVLPDSNLSSKYIIISDGEKRIGHVSAGENWASEFKIKVRNDAPAALYDMVFKIFKTDPEYKDEEVIFQEPFQIEVRGVPNFDIYAENVFDIGSTGDINITINNKGDGIAKHVSIALELSAPFTSITSSNRYIGTINPHESRNVSFRVSVSSDAKVKTYKIPIILTYTDDNGTKSNLKTDVGIQINSKPDISLGLDRIEELAPGINGKIIISVANEGFVDAKFLKLTLEPTEDYDVLSINEIYIGNLDSDDVETQEFVIKVNDDVDKREIPLRARLKYKGEGSNVDYTNDYMVNIKILSREEYDAKHKVNGTFSIILSLIVAIPVIFISALIIWFIYKLFGLITSYINRKLFLKT